MNPVYLKHHEIDFNKWDSAVLSGDFHYPYCLSWYLDIVSPGWEALIAENYKQVFPLTFRTKSAISYLYQPFFTQQLGLFGHKIKPGDINRFIKAIPSKFKFIEINLNQNCILNTKDFSVRNKTTHHLSLNDDYKTIAHSYNENTKRNIKKSERFSLKLNTGGNIDSLIKMFKKNAGLKTNLRTGDYKMLHLLMNTAIANNSGCVYEAKDETGNLLAGLFLLSSKTVLINLFNATTRDGKNKSAMFFLMNEILKQHAGNKLIFDFEGSEIAEVARFYKGFGGIPVQYPHIRLNRLPWPIKWIKK